MKQFFVEMFLYGGVVVPAFDALSLKIKAVMPSFKKKKGGALAAEVEQVQNEIWNAFKKQLKLLSTGIEKQSSLIDSKLRESFEPNMLVNDVQNVTFSVYSDEEAASILALAKEKASELSREKAACAERVSQVA